MHECMVWITIKSNLFKKGKRNVNIGCVYMPPLDSSYNGDKLDTFDILDYEVARYIRIHDVMKVGDSLVQQNKRLKKNLYVCFIDFTKAFDYMNRKALINKLFKRNVSGNFLNLLKSMFSKSKTRLNWGKDFSMPFISCFGVIQGGVLSPQLFNKFSRDLCDYLDSECGVKLDKKLLLYLLFADDLILFSHSAKGLQKQLNCLSKYCAKWHLIVNVVIYNSAYALRNCVFKYGDEFFKIINTYKYLSMVLKQKQIILRKFCTFF